MRSARTQIVTTFIAGLVVMLAFVATASWVIRDTETEAISTLLNQSVRETSQRTQTVSSVAYGMQGLIHSIGQFNGDQFRAFAEEAITRHDFILEASYHQRVAAADRSAFEARAESFGGVYGIVDGLEFPGRRRQPITAPERDEYYPLIYQDLRTEDRAVFGFDIHADPASGAAIDASIRAGAPWLTDAAPARVLS